MQTESRRINVYLNAEDAQKTLDNLAAKSEKAKAKLELLRQQGKENSAEFAQTAQDVERLAQKQQLLADKLSGKVTPSIRDMEKNVSILRKQLLELSYGTEEWKKKMMELQQADGALKNIKAQITDTRTTWQRFKDDFKNVGAIAAGSIIGEISSAAFTAIGDFLTSSMDRAAKLSDQLADIRKTTGATAAEADEISKRLGQIKTRTSKSDLLDMAAVSGQIGIVKDEIPDFVKAMDTLNIALGKEFGGNVEAVVKELGTLRALFKETKEMKADEAMLAIGSAVNELGAAGLATAPFLAEFTSRIGALGKMAPQISETLGLGAALEELGLRADIAAGGISNIMITAGQETAAFAAQVGMTEDAFKKLMNTDPNAMFLKLAESMQGLDPTEVIAALTRMKIGSQEGIKVMQLLAEKTDMVKDKQLLAAKAFAEATSVQDEAALKQKNFAGEYETAKKEIDAFVGSISGALVPALEKGLKWTVILLASLKELPRFLRENQQWFYALGVAMVAFNAQAMLAAANNLRVAATTRIKELADKRAAVAQWALNVAMNANPIGIVISALAALAAIIYTAWNESQIFRARVMGLWEAFKEVVSVVWDFYKAVYTLDFRALADLFSNAGERVAGAFGEGFTGRIKSEMDAAKKVLEQGPGKIDMSKWDVSNPAATPNKLPRDLGIQKTPEEIAAENKKRQEELAKKDKDKNKADADKLKQLAEQRRKESKEAEEAIQEMRLSLMSDGFSKEAALLRFQADKKIADLKGTAEQRATQQLLIEEQLQRDIAALVQKYDDEEILREQEQADLLRQIREGELEDELRRIEQFRQLTTIAAKNAYIQQAAELYENQKLTTEQRNAALAKLEDELRLKEIEAERTAIQEELDTRAAANDLSINQKAALEQKLNELHAEGIRIRTGQAIKEAEDQQKIDEAKHEARMRLAQAASNMLGQAASLAGEHTEFGKALTVAQIAIDTASALSRVISNNSKTALTPIDLAARIASGTALVLGAFVKVRNVLKEANIPKPPGGGMQLTGGYQDGGFTPRAASDSKAVGIVHANEYVVPAPVLRTPDGANLVGMLEALRTGKRAPAEDAEGGSGGMSSALLQQLIAEVTGLRMEVADWNDRLKVIFVYEDFAEFDRKRVQVEKDSTI